jgi:hypothetical protein
MRRRVNRLSIRTLLAATRVFVSGTLIPQPDCCTLAKPGWELVEHVALKEKTQYNQQVYV